MEYNIHLNKYISNTCLRKLLRSDQCPQSEDVDEKQHVGDHVDPEEGDVDLHGQPAVETQLSVPRRDLRGHFLSHTLHFLQDKLQQEEVLMRLLLPLLLLWFLFAGLWGRSEERQSKEPIGGERRGG